MADEIEIVNVGGEGGVASEVTLERLVKAVEKMSKSEGLDPKKTTKALKDLNKEVENGIDVITENRDALEGHTDAVEDTTSAMSNLSRHMGSLALNIAGSLAGSVVGFANELVQGGGKLSDFSQHIPIVGSYLGEFASFLDNTFDSFRDLSSSGASFNNSMQDLMVSAAGARMPIDEFASLVSRNTELLAAFGGTATKGAQSIARMQNGLGGMREDLLNMGFTFEEINEGLIQYQYLNRAGSRAEQRDQAALAQSAGEYLKNLSNLSKLTGQSVDSIQAELQQRQTNTAFQMRLATMDQQTRDRINSGMADALAMGGQAAADRYMQMVLGMGPLTEETRMLAAGLPGVEAALQSMADAATNGALTTDQYAEAQRENRAALVRGALQGAESFETVIAAAASGIDGPANTLLGVLDGMGIDFARYAGLQGQALEDAIMADMAAAEQENNARGTLTQNMAAFDESLREVRSAFMTAFVESGLLDLIAVGLGHFADFIAGFGESLTDMVEHIGNGEWVSAIVGVIGDALSGIWENPGISAAIIGGIAALFAGPALLGAVSNTLTGAVSRMFGGGNAGSAPSGGGGTNRGRGGNAGANMGRNVGGFVGGIAGGAMEGAAKGLAAFANPAILVGATNLGLAITAIGAGIAGAAWLMGNALPTFSEGMKSFEDIDGSKLISAGAGMAAVAGGMAAFGAGTAVAGLGSLVGGVTEGIGKLFGAEDPMEKVKRFAEYDIDGAKVKTNAEALVAFSQAMAVAGGGEVASGLGNAVGAIGNAISSFFGGENGIPYDDITAFEAYNFDAAKIQANAAALIAFNTALTSSAGAQATAGVSSAIGAIGSAIASFFGGETPFEQVKSFGDLDINAEGVTTNAIAMTSMANALSSFNGTDVSEIDIPRALVSRFTEMAAITGTGLSTTATGLQALANVTGVPALVTSLNSLDTDNLNNYNRAMQNLVDTLEELNEVLSEDNSGMFGSGTGVAAANVVEQMGTAGGGSGMSAEKLDQLNTTMDIVSQLLTEIRDYSRRTSRNTDAIGQAF